MERKVIQGEPPTRSFIAFTPRGQTRRNGYSMRSINETMRRAVSKYFFLSHSPPCLFNHRLFIRSISSEGDCRHTYRRISEAFQLSWRMGQRENKIEKDDRFFPRCSSFKIGKSILCKSWEYFTRNIITGFSHRRYSFRRMLLSNLILLKWIHYGGKKKILSSVYRLVDEFQKFHAM